jgi:hypothetical protein
MQTNQTAYSMAAAMVFSLPLPAIRDFVVAHTGYMRDMGADGEYALALETQLQLAVFKQAFCDHYAEGSTSGEQCWQALLNGDFAKL